jgi:hypothetical protein
LRNKIPCSSIKRLIRKEAFDLNEPQQECFEHDRKDDRRREDICDAEGDAGNRQGPGKFSVRLIQVPDGVDTGA